MKTETKHSSGELCLGGKHVHASLAQIEQDSLELPCIRQCQFHRRLHRNSKRAAPLAAEQSSRGAKPGLRGVFRQRLVENEVRAAGQDVRSEEHTSEPVTRPSRMPSSA